jgi:hypothetical protein
MTLTPRRDAQNHGIDETPVKISTPHKIMA